MIGSEPLAATQAMAISLGVTPAVPRLRSRHREWRCAVESFGLETFPPNPRLRPCFAFAVFAGQHAAAQAETRPRCEATTHVRSGRSSCALVRSTRLCSI